jgi:hypothetical protein
MGLQVWRKTKMKRMILMMATAGLLVAYADDIQQRKENQQERIGQGVEKGTLTPRETAHLENKEAGLNHEIHHDRVKNGGNLTNREKARINRQQNHLSRQIYRDKHNGK